ncbi:response regulator [Sinomonas humi]|uniref:LuxR family transcriptional regulator n=1 Tax=Sinomonas humi TaxID=1338436 RepID=A0A0B2AH59_9MICC|nr:response regulator transcription factor [Sinomonas humi]KHL01088.1 LuxR family transcriptional regulator [Sinomonas humi]
MINLPHQITVLVVDDQSLVRDGFTRIVNSQPDMTTVGVAADGKEAIARARELHPDVVLMDIRMPVLDGIEATRTIVSEGASRGTRVLGLTTYDADAYAIRIVKAGAIGFILKDSTAAQLVGAIRSAHCGTFTAAVSTSRRLIARLTERPAASASNPSALSGLTKREMAVFDHLVSGASNLEIAREFGVAEVTIKTHVGHILSKLGARDRVQLVVWAHRQGLADRGPDGEVDGRTPDV